MFEKEIRSIVRKAVVEVTRDTDICDDANLLERDGSIMPADFLYIFDIIEKNISFSVNKFFAECTIADMTIENIARTVYELQE